MRKMEFCILGPLEVRDAGRVVPIAGAGQRALLTALLLEANRVVASDRLAEVLWGRAPPQTAPTALRVHISQLRRTLQGEPPARRPFIVARSPGYVLQLEPGELDLDVFERLVAEGDRSYERGDRETAAATLRDALALWRGPPLADVDEPSTRIEVARLEELRAAATELRIEADLSLGRDSALVSELEALVARYPLRERLRGQLILALYRSGRQADALAAYREARQKLVGELGLEPSAALQALEKAILVHDPALEAGRAGDRGRSPRPARAVLVVPRDERSLDPLLALGELLVRRPPRELIVARIVGDASELAAAARALNERRDSLLARGVPMRTTAFTSVAAGSDAARLAAEQPVDLLLLAVPQALRERTLSADLDAVFDLAPCDVALLVNPDASVDGRGLPVAVPFGGLEHDWVAVELGAWIAANLGGLLRLLGVTADRRRGRRDASRLLAAAALAAQKAFRVAVEPTLAPGGSESVVQAAEDASFLVVGLSRRWRDEGLGPARLAIAAGARPPTLLVRRGLRPGGLAPRETLTRFTWSVRPTP